MGSLYYYRIVMSKAKKIVPIVVIGTAVVIFAAAFIVGTMQEVDSPGPSIGDLLDTQPPTSNTGDNLDSVNIGEITSDGFRGLREDGTFDWYEIIRNQQWRYTLDNGIEWAIVFQGGLGYTKTQTKPPRTDVGRTGRWVIECNDNEAPAGQYYDCVGVPGETVVVRLFIGAEENFEEVLYVTFIDENTLEARFDSMPEEGNLVMNRIVWE